MGLSDFTVGEIAELLKIPDGKKWNCVVVKFPLSDPAGLKRCMATNARDCKVKEYQCFELPDKNLIGWVELG
jgi:hypothetical protein